MQPHQAHYIQRQAHSRLININCMVRRFLQLCTGQVLGLLLDNVKFLPAARNNVVMQTSRLAWALILQLAIGALYASLLQQGRDLMLPLLKADDTAFLTIFQLSVLRSVKIECVLPAPQSCIANDAQPKYRI